MYLGIIVLPILGSIVSGLLGRKVGVTGSHIVTCGSLIICSILISLAFYEVGLCGSPVYINLGTWLDSEILQISWEFYFDQLTVSLGLAVIYCSTLIHIYTIDYLSADPHIQRFFSYLSAFTGGMLVLICGGNYFVMFVGWEAIGVVSYLLINFYFTRIQANKAAILAFTMNRGGAFWFGISNLCLKLSNSGDTLKLMIPNYNWKIVSGQNNYLGMVTSHKMKETEMGYRGSKSEFVTQTETVKEQRVDGSWLIAKNARSLRCTLMGGESRYQVKILSKQLSIRNFSTLLAQQPKLNPWFVTGLVDGEGSFGLTIYKDNRIKGNLVWAVKPSFQISINSKDINLLLQLKEFFGCGINVNKNTRNEASFRVNSHQDLTNCIIPHFSNYPLLTQKSADFILFTRIVKLINNKMHLTEEGLLQIINIRASINLVAYANLIFRNLNFLNLNL